MARIQNAVVSTEMELKDILKEKKAAIVQKWFDAVLETYQEESRTPMRRQGAQFANPVGFNLSQGLEGLFEGLLQGMMPADVAAHLDTMVRIRAIQDFTPSQAVSFIFDLKRVTRNVLGKELIQDVRNAEGLRSFDSAVDDLALYAFDLYMQCREKIYDLKAKEARDATFRLLQKARVITDPDE